MTRETPRQLLARLFKRGAIQVEDFQALDAALVRLEETRDADRIAVRRLEVSAAASLAFFAEIRPLLARAAELAAAAPGGETVVEIRGQATSLPAAAERPRPMQRAATGG